MQASVCRRRARRGAGGSRNQHGCRGGTGATPKPHPPGSTGAHFRRGFAAAAAAGAAAAAPPSPAPAASAAGWGSGFAAAAAGAAAPAPAAADPDAAAAPGVANTKPFLAPSPTGAPNLPPSRGFPGVGRGPATGRGPLPAPPAPRPPMNASSGSSSSSSSCSFFMPADLNIINW